jgi:hypothetical protein
MWLTSLLCVLWLSHTVAAQVVWNALPLPPNVTTVAAVGAAALAGAYCVTDAATDTIVFMDATMAPLRTINRSELEAVVPTFDAARHGPTLVALSASGRLAFVVVHSAVLRIDLSAANSAIAVFATISNVTAIAHHKGLLWIGTADDGIRFLSASAIETAGVLRGNVTLPLAAEPVSGLAVDFDSGDLFVSTATTVLRAQNATTSSPSWTTLSSSLDNVRSLAWMEGDLFVLRGAQQNDSVVERLLVDSGSTVVVANSCQLVAATAEGMLLVARADSLWLVRAANDTKLTFDDWLVDEFKQVTRFARGLISPDGEPPGWVIDSDTDATTPRYHPASPDGAGWTIMTLLLSHALFGDPKARDDIAVVLSRYGGLAGDKIAPSRTRDGIFRHWIDPKTGQYEWDPEFATLSTMFIVAAADRAAAHFPDDAEIVRAAHRIIWGVRNWDAYIRPNGTRELAFKGLFEGGPDEAAGMFKQPFFEGVVFVAQAAAYGSASQSALTAWLNRTALPSAQFLPGFPISSTQDGLFEATFISLYGAIMTAPFRADASWRAQINSIRWSNAAWTDDFGPQFFTVFSAGTTRSDWGGYNADSLSWHPGNITTFPSLLGLSLFGDHSPAVSAFNAYRRGARQTFRTNATLLYRRSDVDRGFLPNSAGLADVAPGAAALAELIMPGIVDSLLAQPPASIEMCPVDANADGKVSWADLDWFVRHKSDLNGDGAIGEQDARCLIAWLERNKPAATQIPTTRSNSIATTASALPLDSGLAGGLLGAGAAFFLVALGALIACKVRHKQQQQRFIRI